MNTEKFCLKRIGTAEQFRTIPLDKEVVVVGRAKDSTFNIPDIQISRKHAIFRYHGDHTPWTVESVGMNGVVINQEVIPSHQQSPIHHMDVIEFGVGSKFIYSFRQLSAGDYEPSPKRICMALIKKEDSQAYQTWFQSKKAFKQVLLEENKDLDLKLQQHHSKEDDLFKEKEKITTEFRTLTNKLEKEFSSERNHLEKKVACSESEKKELLQEKNELEERMQRTLQQAMENFRQKAFALEQQLAQSTAGKNSLLEQKEIIVQQLQQEKELLEGLLNEEKQASAVAALEVSQLRMDRKNLELQIQQERTKFENEKMLILQKGNEAEFRLHQMEKEREERDRSPETTKIKLHSKETQLSVMQVQESSNHAQGPRSNNVTLAAPSDSLMKPAVEVELERMRRELETSVAEKEKIQKELEMASNKARMDVVGAIEDIVEKELQCGICSELYVSATSLNCAHVYCSYCIDQWKKKRNECPVCRMPILTETRSIVIDSAIDAIVGTLSEEVKKRRQELIQQRRSLAEAATVKLDTAKLVIEGIPQDAIHATPSPPTLRRGRSQRRVQPPRKSTAR